MILLLFIFFFSFSAAVQCRHLSYVVLPDRRPPLQLAVGAAGENKRPAAMEITGRFTSESSRIIDAAATAKTIKPGRCFSRAYVLQVVGLCATNRLQNAESERCRF